ncbi:fumarylacetoacetate hydrolase family protein, partial [Undibacterium luofuense]
MHTVTREDQTIVPSKIVCAGRNYVAHIAELGNEVPAEPVIFLKPNSALSEQLRADGEDIHYEGEISFLLKNGKLDAVGFGLDLTRRAVQTSLKKQGL